METKDKMTKEEGIENPAFELQESKVESRADIQVIEFEDLPQPQLNKVQTYIELVHEKLNQWCQNEKYTKKLWVALKLIVLILYTIYFIFASLHYNASDETVLDWCNGYGLLILLTIVIYWSVFYSLLQKFLQRRNWKPFEKVQSKLESFAEKYLTNIWATSAIYAIVFLSIFIFLLVDTANDRKRLRSFFGLLVFVFIAVIFSNNPARIRWRSVVWGLSLQFAFGLIILRWTTGRQIFQCLGDKITTFLQYTDQGSSFVYGQLIKDGIFMFKVLSVIFFFSFITSMLFHLGYMQWIISKIGYGLQKTIGTSPCESMNAAANIFLGQTEAPLIIKPFLSSMTNSELHCVMASGMATIAGSVLAAYISFDISASHLLSASVMSAPAALAASKLLYPETKATKSTLEAIDKAKPGQDSANVLDAASQGAASAVILVANIGGILIAVIAFIGFLNGVLTWFFGLVGLEEITIQLILGKIFIPLAWLMGVEDDNLESVGQLLGVKSFINEFVAYLELRDMSGELTERSKVIATYALCGFSNPASIGIQIAGFSTLAPDRRGDFSKCAIRAYCAGSLACFLTACIAGALIET